MSSSKGKIPFDECNHIWQFHIDSSSSGFPGNKPWCSFFICSNCNREITLQEKCTLEQLMANNKSLKVQEKQSKISMRANIIAAGTLIIAFIVLLLGDSLLDK